jgi:uncharacterized protein (TIGR02246 family)
MRKATWVVMLWVGAGWIAGGIPQASAAMPGGASAEEQVLEVEHQREQAQETNDFAALNRIMADDVIYCHATGHVDTKTSLIDTWKSGRTRYLKITLIDPKVRIDGNVAVINGSIDFTVNPSGRGPVEEHLVTTIVYEKRGGRWQMISSQSTRKPEPVAAGALAVPAPAK